MPCFPKVMQLLEQFDVQGNKLFKLALNLSVSRLRGSDIPSVLGSCIPFSRCIGSHRYPVHSGRCSSPDGNHHAGEAANCFSASSMVPFHTFFIFFPFFH